MGGMNKNKPAAGSASRLPSALLEAPHQLEARDTVQVYSARLPQLTLHHEHFDRDAVFLAGDGAHGTVEWRACGVDRGSLLNPGDVVMIPAGKTFSCWFSGPVNLTIILRDSLRHLPMPRALVRRLSAHCSVLPITSYAQADVMLEHMHRVLQWQCHDLPRLQTSDDPTASPVVDLIKCAFVLSKQLWYHHAVCMYATLDQLSLAQVSRKMRAFFIERGCT